MGLLVGNPLDTWRTRSQHQSFPQEYIAIALDPQEYIAISLDPQSFKEASGILEWDKALKARGRKMV